MDNCEDLLKEAHHRGSNDLQMVVALLNLMARRAPDRGQADLLLEAANRVRMLANARAAMIDGKGCDLCSALRDVCAALTVLAEPRGIAVTLLLEAQPDGFDEGAVTAISMAVNELATNAVKHAFADGGRGTVSVSLEDAADGAVSICVDDDGLPLPMDSERLPGRADGLGLSLTRRLLEDHGRLVMPKGEAKRFEIVLDKRAAPLVHQLQPSSRAESGVR